MLYMPPNLPHAAKATQQFSMLLTLFKPGDVPVTKRLDIPALARI
jgi:quercetin dioxygenase-like cupin family protein